MKRYDVEVVRDVRIPAGDAGATLAADLYLPVAAPPGPALVTVLPYRKDALAGVGGAAAMRWFAGRGYACVLADLRGTGSSDGPQRPPLHPDEADDGVAVVQWAAAQHWCDGTVGMWGASYGAIMAMRTAARAPEALRAIIPAVGMIDPERDFVHPDGQRGALASFAVWGVDTLALHLLPPLADHHSGDQWRRWRERVAQDPYVVDLVRHGPGDPVWRERVVDAAAISVPALCVGGWRDLFCDGTIRAYELMTGPKRLVVGPWMHTLPHESPFAAADFLGMSLRWWDHWLRGEDTGLLDEPAVLLYAQGAEPGWRAYDSWPPAKGELLLATGADTMLTEAGTGSGEPIGEYRPDPANGTLSGLWAIPTTGFGLPLDQHDDDLRALSTTSAPLTTGALLTGRPEVTVRLSADDPVPDRLVVRLADVDPDGRSTFVTAGTARPDGPETTVALWPTHHRVSAGHRLRVVVGDTDFPRLWPLPAPRPFRVTGVELAAPTVPPDVGAEASLPAPEPEPGGGLGLWQEPSWRIERDLLGDAVEVVVGASGETRTADRAHRLSQCQEARAAVRRAEPLAATVRAWKTITAHLATGETIEVTATIRLTAAGLRAAGAVDIDGTTVFTHIWEA